MNADPQWLYLVTSAAPPVLRLDELIPALYADGWSVCVITTPTAASWIDLEVLAATTGCLTRVNPRPPRQQEEPLPRAEAVLAAPMTFNSINKWASGTSDTLALSVLNEMLGARVPIIAAPCVKPVLRQHPAYADSITRLSNAGVMLLDPDAITTRAEDGLASFEWPHIVAALHDATNSAVDS